MSAPKFHADPRRVRDLLRRVELIRRRHHFGQHRHAQPAALLDQFAEPLHEVGLATSTKEDRYGHRVSIQAQRGGCCDGRDLLPGFSTQACADTDPQNNPDIKWNQIRHLAKKTRREQ